MTSFWGALQISITTTPHFIDGTRNLCNSKMPVAFDTSRGNVIGPVHVDSTGGLFSTVVRFALNNPARTLVKKQAFIAFASKMSESVRIPTPP